MIKVVHTLGRGLWGGSSHRVEGGSVVFGGFVDIKEGLAGRGVGFVRTLAIGTFENGVGAGLSSYLAGGSDVVACVVFSSTELAANLLSANCGVVSKTMAGIALAIRLCVSVCCTPCLHYSNE